jgi:glyoxylase I family protein
MYRVRSVVPSGGGGSKSAPPRKTTFTFDLETVMDEPGGDRRARVYRLRGTDVMLGVTEHASNDGDAFRPDRSGLDHVAFSVATRAGVEAWVVRLDEAGVAHSGVIDIPVGGILNFSDPDGIQLSIFHEVG